MTCDSFPRVFWAAEEVRTSTDYAYDNSRRVEPSKLVVQRTLSGAVRFTDRAGSRLVSEGQAMLFTHREDSSYGYPDGITTPYHHRYIAVSGTVGLAELFDTIRHDFGAVVALPKGVEATEVFNELFERHLRRGFRDRYEEAEMLYRLMILIYREQVASTRFSDPVEFGYHWLRDHFRKPVNLKEVAERCGISREHLVREFARRYGEPPGRWLRRLRLEDARLMLAYSDRSVEDVALACGFTHVGSFGRAYRNFFGSSPRGGNGSHAAATRYPRMDYPLGQPSRRLHPLHERDSERSQKTPPSRGAG